MLQIRQIILRKGDVVAFDGAEYTIDAVKNIHVYFTTVDQGGQRLFVTREGLNTRLLTGTATLLPGNGSAYRRKATPLF